MKKKLISILSTVVIFIVLFAMGISTTTSTFASDNEVQIKTIQNIKNKNNRKIIITKKQTKIKKKKKFYYVKSKKYPKAAKIWNYLRKNGYSKKVTAGIMGNIIVECGGQTLAINPYLYSGGYYGICQWSLYYCPSIAGANLNKQLKYLKKTIKPEFDNYGSCSGYTYKQFKKIKNEKTAAIAFAKTYERCASCSYYIRKVNATKAYKYFKNK